MEASKILLLIDGNNLFHRAYHALPPLTDKTGENANAVFGFSNMIIKAIGEVKPTHIAAAFDTKAPTFRHVEFEAYKAQRVAPPPDLYPQLPKVKSVLDAFGIKYFEKAGYEADDLLASIAARLVNGSLLMVHGAQNSVIASEAKQSKKGIAASLDSLGIRNDNGRFNIVILSGDRDLLQIVDGNIKVQAPGWNLKETTLYGAREVKEKYGLEPYQMVDYKSLTGDPSDNVPGVSGIGPKTASAFLQKYHTLENLFQQLDNDPVSLGSLAHKLMAGKDLALAAKKLVELDTSIDLGFMIDDLRYEPDMDRAVAEFEKLGFKSIVSKLRGTNETKEPDESKAVRDKKIKKDKNDQLELV